jgi:hypothetical protein
LPSSSRFKGHAKGQTNRTIVFSFVFLYGVQLPVRLVICTYPDVLNIATELKLLYYVLGVGNVLQCVF